MQLVKEVNYGISIKAILNPDGDNLVITLSVAAPYGSRTVTTTVESFSMEVQAAVKEALQMALDEGLQEGLRKAEAAATQAHMIAAAAGEEI